MSKSDIDRPFYSDGQWNFICDRCGTKVKSSKRAIEWTGLVVCQCCFDDKHEQEKYDRKVLDNKKVTVMSVEPSDSFNEGLNTWGSIFDNWEDIDINWETTLESPEDSY